MRKVVFVLLFILYIGSFSYAQDRYGIDGNGGGNQDITPPGSNTKQYKMDSNQQQDNATDDTSQGGQESSPPSDEGTDSQGNECDPKTHIILNTDIPFVGRCIAKKASDGKESNAGNVFQKLMAALTKIVMAVVVIIGFLAILVGGFMISVGGVKSDLMSKGKGLIIKVIAGLALVGISGIILNLINPNFFKTGNGAGMIVIQSMFIQ